MDNHVRFWESPSLIFALAGLVYSSPGKYKSYCLSKYVPAYDFCVTFALFFILIGFHLCMCVFTNKCKSEENWQYRVSPSTLCHRKKLRSSEIILGSSGLTSTFTHWIIFSALKHYFKLWKSYCQINIVWCWSVP